VFRVDGLEYTERERQAVHCVESHHLPEIDIRQHVSVEDKKGLPVVEPLPVCKQGAGSAKQCRLIAMHYVHLITAPLIEEGMDFGRVPVSIDQNLAYSVRPQVLKPNLEQRAPLDGQKAFGQLIGQRPRSRVPRPAQSRRALKPIAMTASLQTADNEVMIGEWPRIEQGGKTAGRDVHPFTVIGRWLFQVFLPGYWATIALAQSRTRSPHSTCQAPLSSS